MLSLIAAASIWVCMNGVCVDKTRIECHDNVCIFAVKSDNDTLPKDYAGILAFASCNKQWFMLENDQGKLRPFEHGSVVEAVCASRGL